MHGEYKVSGGKLVVIDVEVDNGTLRDVSVSGDFFLEPAAALEAINASLDGLSASSDPETFTDAVRGALPPDAVLTGFSPAAVTVALSRALGQATDWSEYDWQLIHGPVLTTAQNVALDEVLSQQVAAGKRLPTLRLWEWDDRAVVIGSFQSLRNEVNMPEARRHDVEIVRRISGGGAMFMEGGNCITYSLYLPAELVAGLSFVDAYSFLDDWVLAALAEIGVKAWYVPINDITSEHGKIGGAAQKRFGSGTVLHHVTMSYDIDADKMTDVLRVGKEKMSDKGHTSAKKRVDPLRRQTGMSRADIIDVMIATFKNRYGLTTSAITDEELALADERVAAKFAAPEWLERVP
ncbi:lipoate--protein ligase family protein [Spelaeicoccus albus]|uniref:Lipoate-protein ligase A n=1 Tax=Spelaeicoccus albus TaxID=1280376 RepID=A0A7Z0D2J8_9MICO|nr:biotin/lipoate A/B protein ligase family protein [Spelaeicoccus albus]NYI67704.1 lipoate-protein ligase A [Spelaeicoccus albus]